MFFRNLTLFRFSASVASAIENTDLEEALQGHRLRPCGPLEMGTRGFVAPATNADDALTHTLDTCTLLTIASQDKLLPASVVNQELARQVRAIVEEDNRRVGARERKRLKAQLLDQLLPRAFVRTTRHALYLDREDGWVVIDTASRKSAENSLSALRDALGSFPAVPLAPEVSPRQSMTQWLVDGDPPPGLSLGDECELRDPAQAGGAISRSRHQDLESDEILEHLHAGKQVFRLGLIFEDRIAFVLGEDLTLRKLRFLDVVMDKLDDTDADSIEQEMNARFYLMASELDRLLARLTDLFRIPRPSGGM